MKVDWYNGLSDESKAFIQRGIKDAESCRFVAQTDAQTKVDKLLIRA